MWSTIITIIDNPITIVNDIMTGNIVPISSSSYDDV